jgi:DNA-binding NarL/FixJ family response regulator
MEKPHNIPQVMVVAPSSSRRSEISATLSQALRDKVRIVLEAHISVERFSTANCDVVIADLDTSVSAAALLGFLESAPAGTGTVALSDNPDPAWVRSAVAASVNAILARDTNAEELSLALQAAEAGLLLLHPTSARGLIATNLAQSPSEFAEELTGRECQVLEMVSAGLGNKEIASRLEISDHTVKFHISSILGKLNVASRTEAVSLGIRRGIISI